MVPEHSAAQVTIKNDGMVLSNEKGYRMSRSSYGCSSGGWYWEATIVAPTPKIEKDNSRLMKEREVPQAHWRLGWSTSIGELQAPVGYDRHSYGYRDIDGAKVHQAKRQPHGRPYKPGDVVGFYIFLPEENEVLLETDLSKTVLNKHTGKPEPELEVCKGCCLCS
eukprot:TRINITY_DN3323_c0_g1_i2.p1 TRINITY_DN3323_c0_g1~~TRINITY_DN3323_c0_g1_i2.p1  ORF type:complete len:165 (-),score=35.70 TRINITY_DN3323_c0_g1_i2:888-1382(-)